MKTSHLLGNMVIALFVLLNTAGYPANVNAETTGEKEILISRSDMLNVLASSAKSGKPVLTIDPKGHMAGITSIQYTHDGKLLLTASRDKTIRIWRTASGKLERTLRTETGNGSDGFISNIALSPDNRILAVNVINADLKPDIQLLDFKSGAVKQVLNGDSLSTPLVLAFSPDGKILASGSNNGEIILWNIKTGEIIHQFAGNGVMVSDINFSPDGKRLVSASWDKTASLWNVKTGKRISVLARHTYDLSNARFIQDGQFIVTSSYSTKDDILLWNGHTGAFVKTFIKTTSPDNTIRMATSNDGKFVAVTKGNFNKKEYSVAVYSAITGKLVSEFKGHDDGIIAMTFSPENKTIASAGGTGNEVYIWNPRTGRNSKELAGVASSIFSVGFSGGKIGWGKTRNKSVVVNADDIEYQFDLYNPSVRKTSIKNWGVGKTESGGYKASVIADPVLKVYIFKNGQKIYTVPPTGSVFALSTTVSPSGKYTVIGYVGGIIAMVNNLSGKVVYMANGGGNVNALAVSNDERFLLSASADQTIRLWNLKTGKKLLSIFHADDNEWVAWTPEGFFDASENGAKYIGYHINRGRDKTPDYISVAQVYDLFYRPDLVQKKIAGESLQQYADRIDIKHVIKSGLPPRVAILSPDRNKKSKARDVTLRYRLCDQGGGIGKAQIRINGITIGASQNGRALKRKNAAGKVSSCREYDRLLSLQPGNNRISLSAYNRNGDIESPATSVTLAYKGKQKRPDLHVLAIAVDRYRDGDLRLKYSRKDADAIVSALGNGGKKLFGQVHRYTLYDDEVRKQQISNIFDKVSKNARPEDVFVLYVAGHGVTSKDDGNYYYLPVNFRYTSDAAITKQAISNDFFQQNLAKVPAQKSLVLLDTCNSGAFSNIRTRGIEEKTAISRLVKSTGRATIMASSRDQVALEGHKDHGVFTWSLLEGMKGNAYGGDNKLTINELADYVEETLPELTYSKYGYEQVPQRVLQGMNFPLALR